jgi:putative component of toxin-antitoxin plasmid stabilization module
MPGSEKQKNDTFQIYFPDDQLLLPEGEKVSVEEAFERGIVLNTTQRIENPVNEIKRQEVYDIVNDTNLVPPEILIILRGLKASLIVEKTNSKELIGKCDTFPEKNEFLVTLSIPEKYVQNDALKAIISQAAFTFASLNITDPEFDRDKYAQESNMEWQYRSGTDFNVARTYALMCSTSRTLKRVLNQETSKDAMKSAAQLREQIPYSLIRYAHFAQYAQQRAVELLPTLSTNYQTTFSSTLAEQYRDWSENFLRSLTPEYIRQKEREIVEFERGIISTTDKFIPGAEGLIQKLLEKDLPPKTNLIIHEASLGFEREKRVYHERLQALENPPSPTMTHITWDHRKREAVAMQNALSQMHPHFRVLLDIFTEIINGQKKAEEEATKQQNRESREREKTATAIREKERKEAADRAAQSFVAPKELVVFKQAPMRPENMVSAFKKHLGVIILPGHSRRNDLTSRLMDEIIIPLAEVIDSSQATHDELKRRLLDYNTVHLLDYLYSLPEASLRGNDTVNHCQPSEDRVKILGRFVDNTLPILWAINGVLELQRTNETDAAWARHEKLCEKLVDIPSLFTLASGKRDEVDALKARIASEAVIKERAQPNNAAKPASRRNKSPQDILFRETKNPEALRLEQILHISQKPGDSPKIFIYNKGRKHPKKEPTQDWVKQFTQLAEDDKRIIVDAVKEVGEGRRGNVDYVEAGVSEIKFSKSEIGTWRIYFTEVDDPSGDKYIVLLGASISKEGDTQFNAINDAQRAQRDFIERLRAERESIQKALTSIGTTIDSGDARLNNPALHNLFRAANPERFSKR